MPRPLLVGRNPAKLQAISAEFGGLEWSTDLRAALANPDYAIYFDAQTTDRRAPDVRQAIAAGKHVYCEKPVSESLETALDLYRLAQKAGVKHGVVQDKLWLPGLMKLQSLIRQGFFGRILSVRGEFGYWVFEGDTVPAQRPSWNYRKEDGGGIILDMLCHWRYVLDNIFGAVKSVSCLGATHVPTRWNEAGQPYPCTADDSAYATFELEGGIVAHFNSSWCVRVRRDDLLTLQVDGSRGSAIAGLRHCWIQPYGATPRPVWNPDVESPLNYFDGWQKVPEQDSFDNAFKRQWELFLRHVVKRRAVPLGSAGRRQRRSTRGKGHRVLDQARVGGCAGPYSRLIRLATYPAPKPLSILTTVTLLAQLLSIPSSAARPWKLAP